jgi:hypothetical protein
MGEPEYFPVPIPMYNVPQEFFPNTCKDTAIIVNLYIIGFKKESTYLALKFPRASGFLGMLFS